MKRLFFDLVNGIQRLPLWILSLTLILSTTATFMGIVYNYINSKVLVIQAGCLMVIIMGLLFVRWKHIVASLRASRMIQLGLGLWGISMIASLVGLDPTLSFYSHFERGTGMWFVTLVVFAAVIGILLIPTKQELRRYILYPMALSGGLLGFLTWVGVSGLNISSWVILGPSSGGGATMGNSSFAGTLFIFAFFIAGYLWITETKDRSVHKKVLLGIMALTLINPVMIALPLAKPLAGTLLGFIGDARGATLSLILGIVIAVLVMMVYSSQQWIKRVAQVGIGMIAVGIIVTLGLLMIPGSRVHESFIATTGEARFIYWGMALQQVADYPLLGTGPETFRYAHERFYTKDLMFMGEPWADKVHNVYLEQLLTTGVIGFAVYVGLIIAMIVALYRHGKHGGDTYFSAAMIALLVAYGLNNIILFDTMTSLFWFWVLVMVIAWVTELEPEGIPEHALAHDPIQGVRTDHMTRNVLARGVILLVVAFVGYTFIHGQYTKLSLVWDELFSSPPERTAYYARGEQASPYGAAISFAQRADDYSQQYLRKAEQAKVGAGTPASIVQLGFNNKNNDAVADILEINRVLILGMDRYVPNMQSYLALGNLAIAYMNITNDVSSGWLRQLRIARDGLEQVSPTHPRIGYFSTQLEYYESHNTGNDN